MTEKIKWGYTSVTGLNVLPQLEHGSKLAGVCASLKARKQNHHKQLSDVPFQILHMLESWRTPTVIRNILVDVSSQM